MTQYITPQGIESINAAMAYGARKVTQQMHVQGVSTHYIKNGSLCEERPDGSVIEIPMPITVYGIGRFCLATLLPDDFGDLYVPFTYHGMDNYGNGYYLVEQWPDWYRSRDYFYRGDFAS